MDACELQGKKYPTCIVTAAPGNFESHQFTILNTIPKLFQKVVIGAPATIPIKLTCVCGVLPRKALVALGQYKMLDRSTCVSIITRQAIVFYFFTSRD